MAVKRDRIAVQEGRGAVQFEDRHRLLDPAPMALETGYERGADGVLHVAIRTDLRGCSGAMLQWWFDRFRPGTREYRWWHPLDHVESRWIEGAEGSVVGAIHQVAERFTGGEPESLSIQFRDPRELFDGDALDRARGAGAVSAVLCARGGAGHAPRRASDGAVIGTRLIHLCRDTSWGAALRTHFFMGQDLPGLGIPAHELARLFPDDLAPRLLQHCYDEFTFLSRFLPSLHAAEGGGAAPPRPW